MSEALSQTLSELARPPLPRTLRNVLANWSGFLFASVVAFFLSPFLVRHLGNSGYGIWVLIASLTGCLGLLDLGVRLAVTRYLARFHRLADHKGASQTASSALAVFVASGVLVICVSAVLAFFVLDYFPIPRAYQSAARIVFVLAGFSIAVSLVSGVFGGIVVALQRFDLQNAVEILGTAFRALAIVLALRAGRGLIALASIHLAFAVATGLAYAWISFRLYPKLQIRLDYCDRARLRLIFSFGGYSVFLNVARYIVYYSDSVIISAFLPVALVTFFAIPGNLITYSRGLISGLSATMLPLASTLDAGGHGEELGRVLLKGSRYATLIILPIAVTFMLRGSAFIGLWMGLDYAELSGRVLWVLTLALMVAASNQVSTSTMLGISKHRMLVPVVLGEALCNIVLSIILVRHMGILGVAWGTTLPSLAVSFLFWPWYVRRIVGTPVLSYVLSTWMRPAIAIVPFALGTYAVQRYWPASSLTLFFLQTGATLPLALVGAWYLCFEHADRRQFSNYAKSLARSGLSH